MKILTGIRTWMFPGCLAILLAVTWSCKKEQDNVSIIEIITSILDSSDGDFAMAFMDIQTDEIILVNENESFHAASTMKTPVMIEAFKKIHQSSQSLKDSIVVYNQFYSIVDSSVYSLSIDRDSDPSLYKFIGASVSWDDLINRMITRSSNLATNILVDQLTGQNITRSMRELGASYIQVLRGVEDMKAYEAGLSNTTTALDLLRIYEKLARYEVVDSVNSQAMMNILLEQEFNSLIPAGLPQGIKVAHKTGEITGVHHDSGIVFLPDDRRYVLVLLSKNVENKEKADQNMIEVSRQIYEYMTRS